ncbi:Major facilitator superfamily transporter [Acididesulfobacillus acetoxydans]|uniref:Major facilitator superfamily domain, general substrate transporter n=1 Tax=Acididesulfobacillus acetoxydans TaxID=1561005 RepID=A0A8S0WIJ7_9FIRM|nr:MFS transporter [Acididesulfobacillus acetoxydans]CAA7603402.1 Major facilitator superfamily transporter [Acididesulfobacillus acetoxydans]CEJ06501.1 Major facilitator superfamily domain, general substrate transporter [Acididesulfobacillus acetoxydans]
MLPAFLSFAGHFTYPVLMPFYLQTVLNYSATQVGILMAAFPLAMAIAAPLSGYASDKYGPVAGGLNALVRNVGMIVREPAPAALRKAPVCLFQPQEIITFFSSHRQRQS